MISLAKLLWLLLHLGGLLEFGVTATTTNVLSAPAVTLYPNPPGVPTPSWTTEVGGLVSINAAQAIELDTRAQRSSARVWFDQPFNISELDPARKGFVFQFNYTDGGGGNGFSIILQNNGTRLKTNQTDGWVGQAQFPPSSTFYSDPSNMQLNFNVECYDARFRLQLWNNGTDYAPPPLPMTPSLACNVLRTIIVAYRNSTIVSVVLSSTSGVVLSVTSLILPVTSRINERFSWYSGRPYYFGISRGSGASTGFTRITGARVRLDRALELVELTDSAQTYQQCDTTCSDGSLPAPATPEELAYIATYATTTPSGAVWLASKADTLNGTASAIYLLSEPAPVIAVNLSALAFATGWPPTGWPVVTKVSASWTRLMMRSNAAIDGGNDTSSVAACLCLRRKTGTQTKSRQLSPSRTPSSTLSASHTADRASATRTVGPHAKLNRTASQVDPVTPIPTAPLTQTQAPQIQTPPPVSNVPNNTTPPSTIATAGPAKERGTSTFTVSVTQSLLHRDLVVTAGPLPILKHAASIVGSTTVATAVVSLSLGSTVVSGWMGNPASATQAGRLVAILSTVDCAFTDADRTPSYFDYPVQASFWNSDYALYTGSTFLTCLCFIAVPFLMLWIVWVFGRRVTNSSSPSSVTAHSLQTLQRKVISTLCFVTLGYFGPPAFNAFVVVLSHPNHDTLYSADTILVTVPLVIVTIIYLALLRVAVAVPSQVQPVGSVPPREGTEQGPGSDRGQGNLQNAVLGSMFVETFGALFDAGRWRNGGTAQPSISYLLHSITRFYFLEDLLVSSLLQVLNGVQPTQDSDCSRIAGGMLALCIVHLLYLIAVRPYHERLELWLAVVGAILTLILCCLCLAVTLSDDALKTNQLLNVLSIFAVVEMSFFFVQAIFLAFAALAELHRRKLQHQWRGSEVDESLSKDDRPVLNPPLALPGSVTKDAAELHNPLLSPLL